MHKRQHSSRSTSLLVRRFIERSGKRSDKTPEEIMAALIEGVRRSRMANRDAQLQAFLHDRRVTEFEIVTGLDCDGLLQPLGYRYEAGFRMRLKDGCADARKLFTLAHEVCHTFFYELVPEIKFSPHQEDDEEERLCNFGAAALLIPANSLKRDVKKMSASLDALNTLALQYRVSLPTMILRLRALRLWRCEFSRWHRMMDGTFALDQMYGGRRVNWEWEDVSVLHDAWNAKCSIFGHSFVKYQDKHGVLRYKPISFELRRCSNGVIALWGAGLKKQTSEYSRLF